VSGTLRLVRVEARRSTAALLMPLVLAGLLYLAYREVDARLLFWEDVSLLIRDGMVFIGPVIGGLAAWMAGRERRRGMDDLLATTPLPVARRRLATWAGTMLWGLGAAMVIGLFFVVGAAPHTAAGGPHLSPLLVGLVAVPTYAAIGFALGSWFPNRFDAAFAAVGLFLTTVVLGLVPGWVSLLSPIAQLNASPWFGIHPDLGLLQALFLAGLAATALATVGLGQATTRAAWGRFLGGLLVAGGSAVAIAVAAPPIADGLSPANPWPLGWTSRWDAPKMHAADPVCRVAAVTVCVQPAFAPLLDDLTARVTALTAPVRGLPGVPTRFEQMLLTDVGRPDGTVATVPALAAGTAGFRLDPTASDFGLDGAAFDLVDQLLSDGLASWPGAPVEVAAPYFGDADDGGPPGTVEFLVYGWTPNTEDAPTAIQIALLTQADVTVTCEGATVSWTEGGVAHDVAPAPCAAAARFAALDPVRQRVWLETNFTALRAGALTLEDLP